MNMANIGDAKNISHAIIARNIPVLKSVPGHHSDVPFLITGDMFGEVGFEIAGGEISELIGRPVSDPHTHEVPEIYLLLAPRPGGAVLDILAGTEHHEVVAPAAMFIPAGTVHRFVTKEAMPGSFCLGVLLTRLPSPGGPRA
jgi:hypothetical protein